MVNDNQADTAPTEALFKFINNRPQWEQDAIRRLYLHGALTENGYQEIYDLFRSENDLPLKKDAYSKPAVALDPKNLPERSSVQEPLVLKKIYGVQNVARLAAGQAINIGANLTLIYGDNGAGKSG